MAKRIHFTPKIYLAHKDADATFARIEAHVVMGIFTTRWLDEKATKQIRKWMERLEFARKLLAEGESLERIAHLTGLPLAQVEKLSPQQ